MTAHTGSSGMNSFYFQMSEDLEILQKQNGNKETLRFLFICVSCFSHKIVNYIFPYFPLKYRLCDVSIVEYLLRQNRMSMS